MAGMSLAMLVVRLPYMVLLAITLATTIDAPYTTTCCVFGTSSPTRTKVVSLAPKMGPFLGRGLSFEDYGV